MDQQSPFSEGIQLRLATTGQRSPHGQRLTMAGIHDVARLVLYYLITLDPADQRHVLHRAIRILDELE